MTIITLKMLFSLGSHQMCKRVLHKAIRNCGCAVRNNETTTSSNCSCSVAIQFSVFRIYGHNKARDEFIERKEHSTGSAVSADGVVIMRRRKTYRVCVYLVECVSCELWCRLCVATGNCLYRHWKLKRGKFLALIYLSQLRMALDLRMNIQVSRHISTLAVEAVIWIYSGSPYATKMSRLTNQRIFFSSLKQILCLLDGKRYN